MRHTVLLQSNQQLATLFLVCRKTASHQLRWTHTHVYTFMASTSTITSYNLTSSGPYMRTNDFALVSHKLMGATIFGRKLVGGGQNADVPWLSSVPVACRWRAHLQLVARCPLHLPQEMCTLLHTHTHTHHHRGNWPTASGVAEWPTCGWVVLDLGQGS